MRDTTRVRSERTSSRQTYWRFSARSAQRTRGSSVHRWIADNDRDMSVFSPLRQELIPDHQIQRNVAEQLMIDLEVLQAHERESVLIGQTLRASGLSGRIRILVQRARISSHFYCCPTEVSWNSGR